MLKCDRCSGLMVRDSLYQVQDQFLELEVERCLNCGHTIDLTFLKKQAEKNGEGTRAPERVLV